MEDHKPLPGDDSEIDREDDIDTNDMPPDDWRTWFAQNGFTLAIVSALLIFLFVKFDGAGLLAIAKAALGLSFVIFIHEMGHLLVAKWCDVHVTSFSIGFGPTLPGCWFKWGETTYKLALIPIGGYVQMVGQIDGDEASDGSEDDPRSYRNKSVAQRMAIISAGVVMNVVLAVIVFIFVYTVAGKSRPSAVVAAVDSRSPCFINGVKSGSKVTRIGRYETNPNFEDLLVTVLASQSGEKIPFAYQTGPNAEPTLLMIEPIMDQDDGRPIIGMSPGSSTHLREMRLAAKHLKNPVSRNSPADLKSGPKFEFSDEIIAMSSRDNPKVVTPLPDDWRAPKGKQKDFFEYAKRMQILAGEEVIIRVKRKDGETVDITVPPGFHRTLGVDMYMGRVTTIRKGSSADGKLHGPNDEKNLFGDEIFAVDVEDANGKTTRFRFGPPPDEKSKAVADALAVKVADERHLSPMRLPYELKQWATRLWKAKNDEPTDSERTVTLYVKRHNSDSGKQYRGEKIDLVWNKKDWEFQRTSLSDLSSPLAVPELGFGYQVRTSVARVKKNGKLKANDVIKRIQFHYMDEENNEQTTKWLDLKDDQWAYAFVFMNFYDYTDKVNIEVERDGKSETEEITLDAQRDKEWPKNRRGILLQPDQRMQKAANVLQAVGLGFRDTYRYMLQVFENIRGMVTGRISVKNIGGPITIARAAYRIADYDFWEFLFFIGMISVNLAVINFLPIPVLDGGHFVFLLYEAIRGKPASENVRIGATYVGLALILALFCFVFYIDIRRALDL